MSRRKPRYLYTRYGGRYYANLDSYADVGGRRGEALLVPGTKRATTDQAIAEKLLSDRIRELETARRDGVVLGRGRSVALAEAVSVHLRKKAEAARVEDTWIASSEMMLRRAVEFFGAQRPLQSISVADVGRWIAALRARPTRPAKPGKPGETPKPGKLLSGGSQRHHFNALSNLYRRAQSEGWVAPGFNPAASMMEKPRPERRESKWLEVWEGALLLESARTLPPCPSHLDAFDPALAYALVGTFLLTGGREAEVLGLEVEDVSFDRRTVTFRPNRWRRLKTRGSARVLPLWPQLEEILRPYIFGRPPSRLLFPSYGSGREAMIVDWRKALDRIAERAGWKKGEVRSRQFRHTYTAARLQTLDGGAAVSPYTVAKELGHGGLAMIESVYAHLGDVRHRSEFVEYRVEQHRARLADRLVPSDI